MKEIYNFNLGRNLYSIRMRDIKKVTLLEHEHIATNDEGVEISKRSFILTVSGSQIALTETGEPVYEKLLIIQTQEAEYEGLYNIYADLITKWDDTLLTSKLS